MLLGQGDMSNGLPICTFASPRYSAFLSMKDCRIRRSELESSAGEGMLGGTWKIATRPEHGRSNPVVAGGNCNHPSKAKQKWEETSDCVISPLCSHGKCSTSENGPIAAGEQLKPMIQFVNVAV